MTINYSFLWPFAYIIKYFFPENKNTIDRNDLIYFDFETTGLNPYHDKIIEYAFIQEENETYDIDDIESYKNNTYITELVNPNKKFEKKISEITGIHPDELEDKETIENQLPTIMKFINYDMKSKNIYLVAHNCDSFDKLFLIEAIKQYNTTNNHLEYKHIHFIDSLNLCKKLLPDIKSYSLKNITKHFNINSGTHRAMSDTIALRDVYHHLITQLATELCYDTNYLLNTPSIVYDYIY
jgi:DNA polymerase III alpha subunit (gram-positive type)